MSLFLFVSLSPSLCLGALHVSVSVSCLLCLVSLCVFVCVYV